jgi:hypothetical protein
LAAGDDAVDLVGMSVYWFGARQPYGDNVLPEDRMFTRKVNMVVLLFFPCLSSPALWMSWLAAFV